MRPILLFLLVIACAAEQRPVFPGAVGYGTGTAAGRDGRILVVTNLDAEGPGSLREAVTASGPRTVVFAVAGVIDLGRRSLVIREPHLTIAGATAPDPGVTIVGGGLHIQTHDVLVSHLELRPGDKGGGGWEPDGLTIGTGDVHHVVADHCSMSWGVDENASISSVEPYPRDVTISNCIIAEGLSHSVHAKGEHSKGLLLGQGCTRISIIGNLMAHNYERSPYVGPGCSVVVANNLIYNPGFAAMTFSSKSSFPPIRGSIAGNLCIVGPDSRGHIGLVGCKGDQAVELWLSGNITRTIAGAERPLLVDRDDQHLNTRRFRRLEEAPLWPEGLVELPATQAAARVLAVAGARPWARSAIDRRICAGVTGGTGRIIDSQDDVGGYPDHGPVRAQGSKPPSARTDSDGDGFSDLDEWLYGVGRIAGDTARPAEASAPAQQQRRGPARTSRPEVPEGERIFWTDLLAQRIGWHCERGERPEFRLLKLGARCTIEGMERGLLILRLRGTTATLPMAGLSDAEFLEIAGALAAADGASEDDVACALAFGLITDPTAPFPSDFDLGTAGDHAERIRSYRGE